MNPVDLVFLVGMGLGLVLGAWRGMFYSALVLAKYVGAAVASLTLLDQTRPLVQKIAELPAGPALDVVPWLAGFLLISVILTGVLTLLRRALKKVRFKGDLLPAALLGAIAAGFALALLLPAIATALPRDADAGDALAGSRTFAYTSRAARAPFAGAFLPRSFTPYLEEWDASGEGP